MYVLMKRGFLLIVCLFYVLNTVAQITNKEEKRTFVYPQRVSPLEFDNYLFSTYYFSGRKTYNLRNSVISSSNVVSSFKINPSGSSFALLNLKNKRSNVSIYNLWSYNQITHKIEDNGISPTAICYFPDAKIFVVAGNDKKIIFYDTHYYKALRQIELPVVAEKMAISNNNYFLACVNGNEVYIWNLETNELRKRLALSAPVNDIVFSNTDLLAVLSADGKLTTYDTRTFQIHQSYDAMGYAVHCSFHPSGKYLAIVTGEKRISILNLLNEKDRQYIDNSEGGISDVRFLKNGKDEVCLVYNTKNSITYELMDELSPFYGKLLTDELNDRMNTWMKKMDNESLEEYNNRVNNKTRTEKMLRYEQEISTRMADHLIEKSDVTLGNYNPKSNMLAVDFSTMPTIYLNVPEREISDFKKPENLEFRNALYGVTKSDRFELIYADVYNKLTGKTYTFNNLNRQSLDYLKSDENFVPLDLVQKSSMDEMQLKEIKNNVVSLAKQKNTISDNTNISVNTSIVSNVDASGKKVMNYQIKFSYTVDKFYSAKEDFVPGKYKTEQSGAAMAMLSIMKKAFESEFAQYIVEGKKLRVKITGMADAIPILEKITYDGIYGEFTDEPIYKDNNLSNITVNKGSGVIGNDQLAFLRAEGVKDYMVRNIPALSKMDSEYNYYIEIAKEKGSEYRRIGVEFTIMDAF
jgi:WD40 repeat protein